MQRIAHSTRWRFSFTTVAATLLLATQLGCETPAQRLDRKAVETIQPGVTTRQDVLRDFGEPEETTSADGRTLLFYERDYEGWRSQFGPTEPATIIGLSVLCDSNDLVLRTHYSFHHVDIYVGAGTVSAGSMLSEKARAQIKTNVTTRKEALGLLGEPALETLTLKGRLILHWGYWEANFAGGRKLRGFSLVFNEEDVVIASMNDVLRQ